MTKIDIFSGFLGAGKTTLIKKLIKEVYKNEKLVLIENEFGEIGIDGGFMKEAEIEVTEMNSGCICCSLVGDFSASLKKVIKEYNPDRILIEPSGVGKLSDVISAVNSLDCKDAKLNSYCTVVDANKCKMYMKNFGEFFNNQVENASCIILSHTNNISEAKLEECIKLIREKNSDASLLATPWDELSGDAIFTAIERKNSLKDEIESLKKEHEISAECGHVHHHEHCECHEHHDHHHECHEHHDHTDCSCHHHEHHHHHAEDVFSSWGVETTKAFTKEELESILSSLEKSEIYGTILRAKGIVKGETDWFYFDYIPSEIDIRCGSAAAIGKICVIGSDIKEDNISILFGI